MQKYISRVRAAVLQEAESDRAFLDRFEQDMAAFDADLTSTLEAYLSYLQNFVTMIQSDSSLLLSTYQKSLLEEEWTFIKQTWSVVVPKLLSPLSLDLREKRTFWVVCLKD